MRLIARYPFLMILALGLGLRIAWALAVPVMPVSDSFAYQSFARMLVEHRTYGWNPDEPSAYWAVGTSGVLAALYLLHLDNTGFVVINLLAAAASIVLICRLGQIYFSRAAGLGAALVTALWPNLIVFTTVIASETLFIALALTGLWLWARRRHGISPALLAGLVWGAGCYVRPIILLMPLALVIAELPHGPWRALHQAARALSAILVILIVISPWTIRNYEVFGKPVLVSTNFGPNFWMGNNPKTTGGYMPLPDWVNGMNEVERSDALVNVSTEYIRSHLGAFLQNTLKKTIRMYTSETIGIVWNEPGIKLTFGGHALLPMKLLLTGYWALILILGLVGLTLAVFQLGFFAGLFHPIFSGWAYFTAINAVIVTGDRYHMPAAPFIALYSGHALATFFVRCKSVARADPLR